ncbi:hypothetical protein Q5P01_016614 [Channa striata]|uniref:Uncharacterized protein n=1 Tax=Channa striata TaxID=64152 RepID=A0AA88M804_CHASR|nr:hypothetical protein Q5P01_016614 [Channa striata]
MTRSATVSTASPAPSPVPPTKTEAPRCGPVWFRRDELWWGEEWKDVQIKGEIRDDKSRRYDRRPPEGTRPSRGAGIGTGDRRGKRRHRDTRRERAGGSGEEAHGDPVRGLRWGLFGSVLADEPVSRGGRVRTTAGEEAGRLFERDNVNTTLVENALGDPLSKTLVLDPVVESDLKGAFFCKLESTRRNDVVSVFLEARRDGTEGTTNNGHWESEPRAATRGPR